MQISPISNLSIKSHNNNENLKQQGNKVANRLLFASFIGVSGLAITAQCYGRKTTPTKLLKEWFENIISHFKNKK